MHKFPFDVVLLDADETIFDFKQAEKLSVLKTAESFGLSVSRNDADEYSKINLSFWKLLEQGIVTREQLKVQRFEKWFDYLQISGIDSADFACCYEENLSNTGILFEGALEFVKSLSELSEVYIVTNGLAKCQHGRMDKSPVREYLSGIFISEEVGYTKPDKRFFNNVFGRIGIHDKSKVIIIGDSLTSDMQGGRNAGIKTCLYAPANNCEENHLCDYVISDYNEFFNLFT